MRDLGHEYYAKGLAAALIRGNHDRFIREFKEIINFLNYVTIYDTTIM
jgi:hypothetical protein